MMTPAEGSWTAPQKAVTGESQDHASAGPRTPGHVQFLAIAIAAPWASLVWKLRTDWSTNAQYEFGIFVPLLLAYLLARRWPDRPDTSHTFRAPLVAGAGAVALFLLLPIRMIAEANPDWRPLNWVWATDIVLLTLLSAGYVGGWAWVRHFSAPLMLIFFALSWPLAVEQSVIQGLARFVAKATVELLSWLDIPALQHGNVIELAGGREVGIADACSGVRSVAGTLMAAYFFGEYYRLAWTRRIGLIAGGLCVALFLNLCRTTFLSWQEAQSGVTGVERWHDPAGYLIFCVAFLALWLLASLLGSRVPRPPGPANARAVVRAISPALLAAVIAWVLVVEVANELWYRVHESARSASATWQPKWPSEGEDFQFHEVPDQARAILRYSEGQSAQLGWPDGSSWTMFFFRWAPGRTSSQLAVMHRPEICLPATGLNFLGNGADVEIDAGAMRLPFRATVFDEDGNRVYVYRCLWEDRASGGIVGNGLDMSISGRLKAVWHGRRNLGQRLLQVCIAGAADEEDAERQLQQRLPNLITATDQNSG